MNPSSYRTGHVGGGSRYRYPDAGDDLDADRMVLRMDAAPQEPSPRGWIARWLAPNPRTALLAIGWMLFVLWCAWWAVSLTGTSCKAGGICGFSRPCLAVIFTITSTVPRVWWNGGDPYGDPDYTHMYFYPPLVPRLFSWVNWLARGTR